MHSLLQVLEALAIIIASFTAIWGIASWRLEFIGKRKIELSEELLAKFYEARDVVRAIRNPLGYSGEGSSRVREPDETDELAKILNSEFVTWERYAKYSEFFGQLHALKYRAIAQLGKRAGQPFELLFGSIDEIFQAASTIRDLREESLARRDWRRLTMDESDAEDEEHKRQRRILWESHRGEDKIAQQVDEAVAIAESICHSIQAPGFWPRKP